ncbi:MAG: hypothetical protein ACAH95_18430 [Fimbriimonas sp.]
MKVNQNDLIISIVAVVLGLGFSAAFFFMQRKPIPPQNPTTVNISPPALPAGNVVMANALPGGGSTPGGGGGGGFGGGARGGGGGRPGGQMSGSAPPPGIGPSGVQGAG